MTNQPLKALEIPLSKFTEEVIPHYQALHDKQKILVPKLIAEKRFAELRKEVTNNEKAITQLRDLMYELEALKLQVKNGDMKEFDAKTLCVRKSFTTLITAFTDFLRLSKQALNEGQTSSVTCTNPFEEADQIQMFDSLEEMRIRELNEKCARIEALNEDADALHGMFDQLNEMVQTQSESVQDVSEDVETTSTNVNAGLKHLQVAHRLKPAAYPMTGAVLGGVMAGPVGMIAGAKVGALVAVICAFLGYTGGKFFKKANDEFIETTTKPNTEVVSSDDKKND